MTPEFTPHLLVVDDEHFIRDALQLYFESNGFRVSTAGGKQDALQIFGNQDNPVDAVILDLVMPGTHGLDLLQIFKQIDPDVQVIIATGCGSMGSAIEALRLGAFDFITKPILDFDRDLMKSVRNALMLRKTSDHKPAPQDRHEREETDSGAHWLKVCEDLNDFANTYVGEPLASDVLDAVWRIFSDGFGADAAALAEGSESEWNFIHWWGVDGPEEHKKNLETDIAGLLSSRSSGPYLLEIRGHARVFTKSVVPKDRGAIAASRPTPTWSKILQLPLHYQDGLEKHLLLLYRREERREAEEGPLALLTTAISPVLSQDWPESPS